MIGTLDWRLLHLADSALPTGAYAFSNGLEAAAKIGMIRTGSDLDAFIEGSIRQLYNNELAFIRGSYALNGDVAECAALLAEYDAMVLIPEMRRASLTLGGTWMRLMNELYGSKMTNAAKELALHDEIHFVTVYGTTMREAGYAFEDAADLFVYGTVRDLASSAIRLGLIGPSRGHVLVHRLCQDRCNDYTAVPCWRQATRCFPILEVAQAAHSNLYSRLFQN